MELPPVFQSGIGAGGKPKQIVDLPHNNKFPALASDGSSLDNAKYTKAPDRDFPRPFLAIPGERAFVWPLGVQGFNIAINPTLGTHKYLGSNRVEVEVVHVGEEHIRLSGVFPGFTSAHAMNSLRDIIFRETPERGKVLYLPLILPKYQFVKVESAEFDHPEDDGYSDIAYTISFIKVGVGDKVKTSSVRSVKSGSQPSMAANAGNPSNTFIATSTINTVRSIAQVVYGDPQYWYRVADPNKRWFISQGIPLVQVPNYRLPPGTSFFYD